MAAEGGGDERKKTEKIIQHAVQGKDRNGDDKGAMYYQ